MRETVGAALHQRLQAVGDRVELEQLGGRYVLLEPANLPCALHRDDLLASELLQALDGAVLERQHVASAPGVAVAEIDDLGALLADTERGDDHVDLAALEGRDPVRRSDAGQL